MVNQTLNTDSRGLNMTFNNANRAGSVRDDVKSKQTVTREIRDRSGKADDADRPNASKFYGKSRREKIVVRDGKPHLKSA